MNENISVEFRIRSLSDYVYRNWSMFETTSVDDSVLLLCFAYRLLFDDCYFMSYVVSLVVREVVLPLQIAFK